MSLIRNTQTQLRKTKKNPRNFQNVQEGSITIVDTALTTVH